MNYIIANDVVLTSLGAADGTVMFPTNLVLGMSTGSDTALDLNVRSPLDTDDADRIRIIHADTNTTEKAFRNMVDEVVSVLNGDYEGAAVLFDVANNISLPGQTLSSSTVTQD
jgi:hypothetical protein|tara:strand:+ start:556 stop:894 length:339 start_codon:yes stop_codon:yes gene_type:complete